jgi:tetratricopeptide (TPR) repeat protein
MEKFEIDRHTVEVGQGRYFDLQLTLGFRPMPAERVIARREQINAIYRELARSNVVIVTLGLIEAWFDHRSQSHINCPPPKSVVRSEPDRFELQILDYNEVLASLRELTALLDRVCPKEHRVILTVSPVPLTATFTMQDVAVANTYSKAVLRAATEAIVAERGNIEYFPSYESVVLTDRSQAFTDDQIHVDPRIIRFNVERMINRYVEARPQSPEAIVAQAKEEAKSGKFSVGLKTLQRAWQAAPDNQALTVALGEAFVRAGQGAAAETLLLRFLRDRENADAHGILARHFNDQARYEEAAFHSERAVAVGKVALPTALQRVIAYYHLGRFEEGLKILETLRYAMERKPLILFWKARFLDKLGRATEAEEHFRQCNGMADDTNYRIGFAAFLAAQGRWEEIQGWIDPVLKSQPNHQEALRLRTESGRQRDAATSGLAGTPDHRAGASRLLAAPLAFLRRRGR